MSAFDALREAPSTLFAPGVEEREAEPLVRAVRAFRELGYDPFTIVGLFLQGAAVLAESRMSRAEFDALARRYFEVTTARVREATFQVAS